MKRQSITLLSTPRKSEWRTCKKRREIKKVDGAGEENMSIRPWWCWMTFFKGARGHGADCEVTTEERGRTSHLPLYLTWGLIPFCRCRSSTSEQGSPGHNPRYKGIRMDCKILGGLKGKRIPENSVCRQSRTTWNMVVATSKDKAKIKKTTIKGWPLKRRGEMIKIFPSLSRRDGLQNPVPLPPSNT